LGVWRILGYAYAGLNILGGFILIGAGMRMSTQPSLGTGFSSGLFDQIGGLALIYGGLSGITLGIVLIWALVKSGQIESIDKNIKIIAEWAKSQMRKEQLIPTELPKDDNVESIK
jgi:hypothetical protein